tara:strand:+ start:1229 stop:1852 length:624 start_codon:yes stop_codon:yes gene_type:complete
MELGAWVALATVFALGAVSPGPSLAVVIRNTVTGGRSQGISTGLGHGLGFGLYAFLAAAGIATALSASVHTEQALRWGGVIILLWLGTTFLRHALAHNDDNHQDEEKYASSDKVGFLQGFSIAILNPKIMAWMLALYTPFIEADLPIETLIGMGLLGMSIDGAWYVTVATTLATGDRVERLKSNAHLIDGAMGLLMFLFAYILVSGF